MLSEEIKKYISKDPFIALDLINDTYWSIMVDQNSEFDCYNELLECAVWASKIIENNKFTFITTTSLVLDPYNLSPNELHDFFSNLNQDIDIEKKNHLIDSFNADYESIVANEINYFYQADIIVIQNYITELRDVIRVSDEIDEDHRRRLLTKLERLQSELDKRICDREVFASWLYDYAILAKKLGVESKIVKLASNLMDIIIKKISEKEAIGSELKDMLPSCENNDDEE